MPGVKKTVYVITLCLIFLPFVLVTDIFPFFRFGMFAEPVRRAVQTESFVVEFENLRGQTQIFNPEKYEIPEENFQYLARNYYYRKEAPLMLKRLRAAQAFTTKNWSLFKITFPIDQPLHRDTIRIMQLP